MRFDVSAERGLTPYVGKQRELDLLLDGFARAKSGRGQVFAIVSEAGGGKSRILYEFRKAVSTEDLTILEGKCLSYSKSVAYHPVIDILKSHFEISEENANSEITEKVKIGLKALDISENGALPYILELLSVENSGVDLISVSPEDRKIRTIEVLYNSIPAEKRKTLHLKIGLAIEKLYKDKLAEHLVILAEHFVVSENYEKAAGYLKKPRNRPENQHRITMLLNMHKKECLVWIEYL